MDIPIDHNTVVVFDLDDTLYFEIEFLKSAYKKIAKNIQPEDWETLYAWMFSLFRCELDVFAQIEEHFGFEKTKLLVLYREHVPDIEPRSGVLESLNQIRKLGGQTAIVTDGRSSTQRAKIKALGLEAKFDVVVISEEIGSEKPDIRNFQAVENTLGKTHYMYFGDNPRKDFISPKQLGWKTIGLLDNGLYIHKEGYKYHSQEFHPDKYIEGLNEVHWYQVNREFKNQS